MKLTDTTIRAAKPASSDYKLADGRGLYLLVTTRGTKLWKVKYRFAGIEKKLSLGSYPDVSLKDARTMAEDARRQLGAKIDPSQAKRAAKLTSAVEAANTFKSVADDLIAKMEREARADITVTKAKWLLSLLAPLHFRPITDIQAPELLAVLKKREAKGHLETCRRLRSFASRVFCLAVATGRGTGDPSAVVRGALTPPKVKHLAAITDPIRFGDLLRAIPGYSGQPTTVIALALTPHVYQRPGEVRTAEWSEMDLDRAIWTVPGPKMKMRDDQRIPLSTQAVALLREIQCITGHGRYVFPSTRSSARPMSENTINAALKAMGFAGDEMCAHGFRTTASTLLNESGRWNPDAIERSLSHKDKNAIRAIYNRSEYWEERVDMAQWWSDHLDMLRGGAKIISFRAALGS